MLRTAEYQYWWMQRSQVYFFNLQYIYISVNNNYIYSYYYYLLIFWLQRRENQARPSLPWEELGTGRDAQFGWKHKQALMPPLLLFTRWSREGRKGQTPPPSPQATRFAAGGQGMVEGCGIPSWPLSLGKQALPSPAGGGTVLLSVDNWRVPWLGRRTLIKLAELGDQTGCSCGDWAQGLPGQSTHKCLWNHGQIRPRHWNSKQGIITFKRLHESVALPALYLRLGWRCNVSSTLGHFLRMKRGPGQRSWGSLYVWSAWLRTAGFNHSVLCG